MGVTITLKNIPDDIYDSLKQAADANHRSINSEVIECLERILLPIKISNEERLARARRIRERLKGQKFKVVDILKGIDADRRA
jgi:plasmid stability protein